MPGADAGVPDDGAHDGGTMNNGDGGGGCCDSGRKSSLWLGLLVGLVLLRGRRR